MGKFDFPCFITFLIRLAPKVYSQANDEQVAVTSLIEDFILPLFNKVTDAKQDESNKIGKLINLVNSKVMVDFMSELFCTLQDLYPKYATESPMNS